MPPSKPKSPPGGKNLCRKLSTADAVIVLDAVKALTFGLDSAEMARTAFLALYGLSGGVALLYQVAWIRLLTLHMGHTAAAVGTVLAAFMGGLALGAALGGRAAVRLPRQRALAWYARLEIVIAACALLVPLGLAALQPLLHATYLDGAGPWFGAMRALSSLVLIAVPAAAMGATLPLAVRWFAGAATRGSRDAGALYAVNTIGAAFGAAATGFVLLPALGLQLTTTVGVVINIGVALAAFRLAARTSPSETSSTPGPIARRTAARPPAAAPVVQPWLAAAALGVSGFVALLYEVIWTRALALVLGPTTYAFTTMVVAFIIGIACGAWAASRLVDRIARPVLWLAASLAMAALGALAASLAIGRIPLAIAETASSSDATFVSVAARQAALIAPLLIPMTVAFGAAFPFAVAAASRGPAQLASDVARVYAANTAGAISGALAGSFLFIPWLGLHRSIALGGALLAGTAVLVAVTALSRWPVRALVTGGGVALAAAGFLLPPWNVHLLSSGAYLYGADAAGDPQSILEAGELLYYAEGAAGTVSVRRVAGTTSLAIDGKVDASNGADMLTQKLLAHLPLMLHPSPRRAAVIGYGSGVTAGAALQHPVARLDVLEISPEVIAASPLFRAENHDAPADGRARIVITDGRTHLMLSAAAYDVIISEPSNPWMAGIAALFTREFFSAARSRLAPGGVFCQWAHTYDIADADLRSIVATFASVFPDGSMWLVGDGDLLLIGSTVPVTDLLGNITDAWAREAVARDLGTVGVRHPFALFSMFLAGGPGLLSYGRGEIQTDDRLALEFSAPRGMYAARGARNAETLRQIAVVSPRPVVVSEAIGSATASMWRDVGLMHLEAKAADAAYAALARAASSDARDEALLDGLLRAAAASGREDPAARLLEDLAGRDPRNVPARVALSRLRASAGQGDAALAAAGQALQIDPGSPVAREQLASLFADAGDAPRLDGVVRAMVQDAPGRPGTLYYQAVLHFLRGQFTDAAVQGGRAAAADPANARVHNLLGAAFANLGQPDRARAAFEAAARRNPRDPAALTNLGLFELESSNSEAAAARFAEALVVEPGFAAAAGGLADALERQGETARAARLRGR